MFVLGMTCFFRYNEWCDAIAIDKENLPPGSVLCSAHFVDAMFVNEKRLRLKKTAVPTNQCHSISSNSFEKTSDTQSKFRPILPVPKDFTLHEGQQHKDNSVWKPPCRISVSKPPCSIGVSKPPNSNSVSQPPRTVSVSKPPCTFGVSQPPCAFGVSQPPCTIGVTQAPCHNDASNSELLSSNSNNNSTQNDDEVKKQKKVVKLLRQKIRRAKKDPMHFEKQLESVFGKNTGITVLLKGQWKRFISKRRKVYTYAEKVTVLTIYYSVSKRGYRYLRNTFLYHNSSII